MNDQAPVVGAHPLPVPPQRGRPIHFNSRPPGRSFPRGPLGPGDFYGVAGAVSAGSVAEGGAVERSSRRVSRRSRSFTCNQTT